jgi:deoxycytidine triphosphate deaminase
LADDQVVEERELVSRPKGKQLAEAWANNPQKLKIPDTLLTSDDIVQVVEKTGAVSPFFYSRGLRKDRLKKAAYEGRIGTKAFKYENRNCPEQVFNSSKDEYLKVPKNSIVFVECDLDFRIPDFLALRFNLQIQHVHRGLLLGTGPLIDPGFWGKLCIPLHNLTDEDYEIPRDEGLIWIEFTKTTLPTEATDKARAPQGSVTEPRKEHWDIEKFLHKAADQFRGHKVPIKSSLPTMFEAANASVKKSAEDAKSAADEAKSLRTLNLYAMVAAAIALAALSVAFMSFHNGLSGRNEEIAGTLSTETALARDAIDQHILDVDRYGSVPDEARSSVPALRGIVERQQGEINKLSGQISVLTSEIERLKPKPCDRNRPGIRCP